MLGLFCSVKAAAFKQLAVDKHVWFTAQGKESTSLCGDYLLLQVLPLRFFQDIFQVTSEMNS